MSRRPFLALALLVTACGEGKLNIVLDRPTAENLDPLRDARLAKFSLRVIQGGQATDQDVFRGSEADLTVGEVPTGTPFDLRLAGKTAADETLGLGMVLDVEAASSGETTVSVKFRKPVGFVAVGDRLQALNTAGDDTASVELGRIALPGVTDVATTPTGVMAIAVAGKSLVPIPTANHVPLPATPLELGGTCIAISPDSRHAVVCHAENAISIVTLDLIGSPDARARRVNLGGPPSRVAFGTDRRKAWLLLDAMGAQGCSGPASTVVELSLGEDRVRPVKLDKVIADLAVDPRDGGLLMAVPCEAGGRLGRLEGDRLELDIEAPGVQDLAVTDRSVVTIAAASSTASEPARLRAQVFDLSKPGFEPPRPRDFLMPFLALPFIANKTDIGSFAWLSEAQQLRVRDVAVSADGRRAVALFWAKYFSSVSFGGCKFEVDVDTDGYLLLDLASGTVPLQRYTKLVFHGCLASCLQSMGTLEACQTAMQDLLRSAKVFLEPPFAPTSAALLFGGT